MIANGCVSQPLSTRSLCDDEDVLQWAGISFAIVGQSAPAKHNGIGGPGSQSGSPIQDFQPPLIFYLISGEGSQSFLRNLAFNGRVTSSRTEREQLLVGPASS